METLSKFDIFKQPVMLTMNKSKGLKFSNGSIAGFFLSFVLMTISLIYVINQHNEMESFANDDYKSEIITNSMKEWAEFKMEDYNFMPSIEILPYGEFVHDE